MSYVCPCIGGFATGIGDATCQSLKAIRSARPKYYLRTTRGEQKRSRLANSAACAGDDHDLVIDSG